MTAAAGAHETSRGEDHVKGETKSLEQDVRLSSRFRVRLYITYSFLFPTAHLVLFPLTGTARGKQSMRINFKLIAFARMFTTVTTHRTSTYFFSNHSQPIRIYIYIVGESRETSLMAAEGLYTLTTVRGKSHSLRHSSSGS